MSKKDKQFDFRSSEKSSNVYVVQLDTYGAIKEKFREAKNMDTSILVENMDFIPANSVVIEISYIGDNWCMGYETKYFNGENIRIPHTIHYADIYTEANATIGKNRPKIIFEGENPFG